MRTAWSSSLGVALATFAPTTWAQDVTAGPPPASAVHAPKLPVDLSPLGMFQSADSVVQAVMVGLLIASVATWTVWLAKSLELSVSRRRESRDLVALEQVGSIREAALRLRGDATVPKLVRAAVAELRLSAGLPAAGVKERVESNLERIEASAGRAMMRGTGILATIGSTAPFVGLFGTVWGIMNSFIGISRALTTNLAVVAPGIAEALLATALGLVAAIPAVMIYNVFARRIAGHRMLLADASAAVMRLASRDLDRGLQPRAEAAE